MKKLALLIPALFFLTCADAPILSDLANNRMQLVLKGTYESNDPYGWNTNLYSDDKLAGYGSSTVADTQSFAGIDMFLDIAEVRLATGTGLPDGGDPLEYWTYFTGDRQVFCSSEVSPAGYDLISCRNNNGADNYADFFGSGFTYAASDVPAETYNHMAIYFRKMITGPTYLYDTTYANPVNQTTVFDNRVVNGTNLMDTLLMYAAADTTYATPLISPLERTDLSLVIPGGNDPFVLEVRIFIKNLLMKHVNKYGSYLDNANTADTPLTFVSLSDWNSNHQSDVAASAFQMGGQLVFTARVYDPANVGSIAITDTETMPAYKSYYAVVTAGTTFSNSVIPLAATKRVDETSSTSGTITNLPPGSYDLYKTCDTKLQTASGLAAGQDGFPETSVLCASAVAVTSGGTTNKSITCTCP